jgi:hypothetical protein
MPLNCRDLSILRSTFCPIGIFRPPKGRSALKGTFPKYFHRPYGASRVCNPAIQGQRPIGVNPAGAGSWPEDCHRQSPVGFHRNPTPVPTSPYGDYKPLGPKCKSIDFKSHVPYGTEDGSYPIGVTPFAL